jgi:processive 1,2-diacylglycerol beta-glucosyltransferase
VEATILDPFVDAYGTFYEKTRRDYLKMIDRLPRVWSAVYELLDHTPLIHAVSAAQLPVRRRIARAIQELAPDVIVSVYPLFPYLLNSLFPPTKPRAFRLYTVVTDSITINSAWHRSPSDLYFVPNEDSAEVMRAAGVPGEQLRVLGFPVPPRFARDRPERPAPEIGSPRVLFMINAGKRTAPALVQRLLQIAALRLTVTVGKDEVLRAAIEEAVRAAGRPAEILGWIPNMPELLMTHHLLIGKAGGAAVQETIAACTPMLVTHVVPGQEEGNARLLVQNGCGAVRETPEAIATEIEALFENGAAKWHGWEQAIGRLSRPDAALRMAEEMV